MIALKKIRRHAAGLKEMFRTFSSEHSLLLSIILISAVTLLVYSMSVSNGFVLDDYDIIVNNPDTLQLSKLRDVVFAPDAIKPYYRPLNRASYLIDYQLFGMNPAWFHFVNVIIHTLNAVFLFILCTRILPLQAALFTALLFAVHPINTEAVNYIAARNTLLAVCFSLASFTAFLKSKEKGIRWLILSAFLFFCGLLSKETSFMLIPFILVYSFFPISDGNEKKRFDLMSLLPFLVCIIVYGVMRYYSLGTIIESETAGEGFWIRIAKNLDIIPQYLTLLVVPSGLSYFHVVGMKAFSLNLFSVGVWMLMLLAVIYIVKSKNAAASFGLFWCVANYTPVSGIVFIPSDPMHERFIYMPAIGLFIIVASAISSLSARHRLRTKMIIASAAVLIVLSGITMARTREWKNDFSIFESGVRATPSSAAARFNYSTALREQGDYGRAYTELQKTLEIDPFHGDALAQMGTFAAMQGDTAKAEHYYKAAVSAPRHSSGRTTYGATLSHYNLGKLYENQQRLRQALEHYEQFLADAPKDYPECIVAARRKVKLLRTTSSSTAAGGIHGKRD